MKNSNHMNNQKLSTEVDFLNHSGPDPRTTLNLEKIKSFLQSLGNPQDKLSNVIHIAGTNGKGSTLAFLEVLLKSRNLQIGKYTSPHLVKLNERFILDGKEITDSEFENLFAELSKLKDFMDLTFFEKLTALAFRWFADKQPEYLLLETGLGGRLDATNVVSRPKICLITNIGFDHQEYLGNTIEQIATEKAGILKTNVAFTTTAEGKAKEVILSRAKQIGAIECPLSEIELSEKELGLKGQHQVANARLALTAYEYLFGKDEALQKKSLLRNSIPWRGRFQEIKIKNSSIILDGAHNIEGILSLRASLNEYYPNTKRIFLLGFSANKDYQKCIEALLNKGDTAYFTQATEAPSLSLDPRLLTESTLNLKGIKAQNLTTQNNSREEVFQDFVEIVEKKPNSLGIVAGSLYLVGDFLKFVG
jgi:dihydrofolate synthase/folylpolyglutamate synthase